MSVEKDDRGHWSDPEWPWAIEILTLVMISVGLACPFILHYVDPAYGQQEIKQVGLGSLLWPAVLIGYYMLHLMIARASPDHLSTPLIHLLSPTVAATLSYVALARMSARAGIELEFFSGRPAVIVVLVITMMAATLLLARVNLLWQRRRYAGITWELTSPNRLDRSFWGVAAQFYPLVYPPLRYSACPEGLLVEGWHFLLAIPFDKVNAVAQVHSGSVETSGHYFATADHDLLRIDCSDSHMPIFLSPQEHDQLLHYCAHHVTRRRQPTARGTHAGVGALTQRLPFYKAQPRPAASASTAVKPAG